MRKSIERHGPGEALLKMKLRYLMGDANATDHYLFTPTITQGLSVHYDGAGRHGDLAFTATALGSAGSHIVLSQGYAISSGSPPDKLPEQITSELPPFLLSRDVFGALTAKANANFKFEWSKEISEVRVKGQTRLDILMNGKNKSVPVLHCLGSLHDCQLWVIDDDRWPIIIRHEEEDDFFWKLIEAGSDLEPDE